MNENNNIKGFRKLSEQQKKLFYAVLQVHSKVSENISLEAVLEVKPGDNANQVHVYFEKDWYHYELDSTGVAVWY